MLAARAGYAKWEQAQHDIDEAVDVLADFSVVARDFGVDGGIAKLISRQLDKSRKVYGVSR